VLFPAGTFHLPLFALLLVFADCDYASFNHVPQTNEEINAGDCLTVGSSVVAFACSLLAATLLAALAAAQAAISPSVKRGQARESRLRRERGSLKRKNRLFSVPPQLLHPAPLIEA
jgi:hypothetical protein